MGVYPKGKHPNTLKALEEHRWTGGKPRGGLTEALKEIADDRELARLIVEYARQGNPIALKLWASYRQSLETVTRVIDAQDAKDAIGYTEQSDSELEQALAQAERILTEFGASGATAPAGDPGGESSPTPD